MKFEELDLSDEVLDALWDMHFDECTPIQEKAIPEILAGRDLIACAQTGTGKTAAYLLPVISKLYTDNAPTDAINCVVMAPTRELAQQIDRQMEGFSYFLPISSVAVYGGTDGKTFAQQQRGLKLGADVVIATPGRLLAHLQMGYVDLSKVSFFVLDEADRMLDMGFYDDIMQVVKQLPEKRQTLLFSATMPPKIQKLAKSILTDPAEVKLAVSKPGENIDQSAVVCYETQKLPVLKYLFDNFHKKRVIVFAASKLNVKDLTRTLRRDKYNVAEIHSDLEQTRRDEVMHDFRSGRVDILIATDIVARGIDIDDISMVVNYDVPRECEDYVHRIGRTARAGADGKAVTLVGDRDRRAFAEIERFLGKPVRREELPEGLATAPAIRPSSGPSSRGGKRHGVPRRPKGNGKPADARPANAEKLVSNAEKPAGGKPRRRHHRPKNGGGKPAPDNSK
ncbi:MAG: DEAD/DEAH box helicase [Muribaculaceae bacterium]